MEENLSDQDIFIEELPMAFQYNKRDLGKGLVPVTELNDILNTGQRPFFESVAPKGKGIVKPLETLMKQVLQELHYPE